MTDETGTSARERLEAYVIECIDEADEPGLTTEDIVTALLEVPDLLLEALGATAEYQVECQQGKHGRTFPSLVSARERVAWWATAGTCSLPHTIERRYVTGWEKVPDDEA